MHCHNYHPQSSVMVGWLVGWLVGVVDITGQIITTRLRAVCGVMRDVRVFLALEELMG